MQKPRKLNIDIPRNIVLLYGTTYYNSKNGDRIQAGNLHKYITGKDPEPDEKSEKPKEVNDELIRSKRWDLNSEK